MDGRCQQMETCRFCLEEAMPTTLLEPCQCRGSVRYVHQECLDREFRARTQAGLSAQNCRICGTAYVVRLPIPVLLTGHVAIPTVMVCIALLTPNPVTITILYMTALMNWVICVCWKLVPIVSALKNRWVQCLLATGLLVPIAHWIPSVSILLSFSIPYLTFAIWIADETSIRRIVFGCFGLAEFYLLMGSLVAQSVQFNACLLLSVLTVLPISVLMLTG